MVLSNTTIQIALPLNPMRENPLQPVQSDLTNVQFPGSFSTYTDSNSGLGRVLGYEYDESLSSDASGLFCGAKVSLLFSLVYFS